MTLDRMSYLSGFRVADHYAAPGLFRGSLPAGFAAAVLFRMDSRQMFTGPAPRFVCGNFTNAPGASRGWYLAVHQKPEATGEYVLRFAYADGVGIRIDVDSSLPQNSMPGARTMLVEAFFGVVSDDNAGAPSLLLAVNGTIILNGSGLGIASYLPADAANPFRIGAGQVDALDFTASGQAVAGFAFRDGVPQTPGTPAARDAVRDSVGGHYNQVQAAQDMVQANPGLDTYTNVFSVRRSLRTPQPTWPAVVGSTTLAREGTENLRCDASEPHFLDQRWSFQQPAPP